MKKIKKISVVFMLALCMIVPMFVFSGCGSVSQATLQENYDAMLAKVEEMTENGTFSADENGSVFGIETKYIVSYSDGTSSDKKTVDQYVSEGTYADFTELKEIYNAALVIANDYTETYLEWILSKLDWETLSSDAQSAIDNLNSSLSTYIDALSNFDSARKTMIDQFLLFGGDSVDADLTNLLQFKRKYGALVEAAVDLCENTASVVDETNIMDVLKSTSVTTSDFVTLKNYARAKLLQVYSRFCIVEVSNNMNWNYTIKKDTATGERIQDLIDTLKNAFATYRSLFVATDGTGIKSISSEQQSTYNKLFNTLLDKVDEFAKETDSYFDALDGLDLTTLAVDYKNDLSSYLADNEYAEVYFEKIEQFVNTTLPYYVQYLSESLGLA